MSQLKNLMLDMEDDLVAVVEAIEKSETLLRSEFHTSHPQQHLVLYPGGILRDVAKTKFLEKYPLAGPWFDETWKKIELSC